jgi:hypothetical protein
MADNNINIKNERQINSNLVQTNSNSPEILTNNIYTPAFLRQHIGKLVRVEFLIGTNNLVDRIGILEDVGASYILLRSLESNTTVYADIYSIKFVIISNDPIRISTPFSTPYSTSDTYFENNMYY